MTFMKECGLPSIGWSAFPPSLGSRANVGGLDIDGTGAFVDPLIRVSPIVDQKVKNLPIPVVEFAATPWL